MQRSGLPTHSRLVLALTALVSLPIIFGYFWSKTSSAHGAGAGQSQPALAKLLNPDGTLNVASGFSGSLDARGYRMEYTANGAPRFTLMAPGDENWDSKFAPLGVSAEVNIMVVSGSDLYVGGRFTAVGEVSANRIAKWNGSSWSALGSGVNGDVYAIAVSGSDV